LANLVATVALGTASGPDTVKTFEYGDLRSTIRSLMEPAEPNAPARLEPVFESLAFGFGLSIRLPPAETVSTATFDRPL